jgi:phosphatidylglycerophosphate synthase
MAYRWIANGLTTLRIILTPVFLLTAYREYWAISFLLAVLIGITDILDGRISRLEKNPGIFGTVYDITADFIFIFSAFFLFYWKGIISLFTIIIVPASLGIFLMICLRNRKIVKTYCGKYNGAVCILAIISFCLVRMILPVPSKIILLAIECTCIFYLFLSILENLFLLKKSSQKQS